MSTARACSNTNGTITVAVGHDVHRDDRPTGMMNMITTTDRQILRIALPAIVTNITVPLLGLVDAAIVGHMGAAVYIGAVAVGSMISHKF